MAMQYLERELRRTGDSHDAERADHVAAMLKARGQDLPLTLKTVVGLEGQAMNLIISSDPIMEARDLTASDFFRSKSRDAGLSMSDISKQVGVSESTLSRALKNNKFEGRLKPKLPQIFASLNMSEADINMFTYLTSSPAIGDIKSK